MLYFQEMFYSLFILYKNLTIYAFVSPILAVLILLSYILFIYMYIITPQSHCGLFLLFRQLSFQWDLNKKKKSYRLTLSVTISSFLHKCTYLHIWIRVADFHTDHLLANTTSIFLPFRCLLLCELWTSWRFFHLWCVISRSDCYKIVIIRLCLGMFQKDSPFSPLYEEECAVSLLVK